MTAAGSHRFVVRPGGPADTDEAADVLAEAFDGSPWTAWTVSADAHRDRIRALQFLVIDQVTVPTEAIWVAEDPARGTLIGASLWTRPDRPVEPEVWIALADRIAALEGDRHIAALAAADDVLRLRPTEPHVSCGAIGVRSTARRRGVGDALLAPGLAVADALGIPNYLETSTDENRRWYEHRGFRVTGHVVLGAGPPVWAMRREPGTSERS